MDDVCLAKEQQSPIPDTALKKMYYANLGIKNEMGKFALFY